MRFIVGATEGPLWCALSGPMNNLDDRLSITFHYEFNSHPRFESISGG